MKIVRAETKSIPNINQIIRSSKAIWNYPSEYLNAALPLLEIDENYLTENLAFEILENNDKTIGFFAIAEKEGDKYLDHLWIEPSRLRKGIGRMACDFIFQLAAKKGWSRIFVFPDPPAVGFYEKLGFENTGESVTSRVSGGPIFFLHRKTFNLDKSSKRLYSPSFFQENRDEVIFQLVQQNPLAILFEDGPQSMASHLPLNIGRNERGEVELWGHMARNNPHWKRLAMSGACKIIFQGPHSYISPSWYYPKDSNVPTWNFAVVHVCANFEIVADHKIAFTILKRQIETFESQYQTSWELPSDPTSLLELSKHIVVFRLTSPTFDAKFKLSQQQNPTDRNNVIKELKDRGQIILAQYMEGDFK
jgi:transcriptional regulator